MEKKWLIQAFFLKKADARPQQEGLKLTSVNNLHLNNKNLKRWKAENNALLGWVGQFTLKFWSGGFFLKRKTIYFEVLSLFIWS